MLSIQLINCGVVLLLHTEERPKIGGGKWQDLTGQGDWLGCDKIEKKSIG